MILYDIVISVLFDGPPMKGKRACAYSVFFVILCMTIIIISMLK